MQKITIPSKEELIDLLFVQKLSKKAICKIYDVCLPCLSRWMKFHGLTGTLTPELLVEKRKRTLEEKYKNKSLLERALEGEKIIQPGFNSDFLEEYIVEQQEKENEKKIQNNRS